MAYTATAKNEMIEMEIKIDFAIFSFYFVFTLRIDGRSVIEVQHSS